MSFLASAAIASIVLTAVTAITKLYVQPMNIFDRPSDAELMTLGALTIATVASYVTTAIGAAVRYL